MLDYKNIIIKRYALNLSLRELAEEFGASRSGVNDFIRAFEKCDKLSYSIPEGITNYAIAELVYGHAPGSNSRSLEYEQPDYEWVFRQMNDRKNMTLVYLWNRYKKDCDDKETKPYQYRQFCDLYSKWCEDNYETIHIQAVAGQKMEVDFAGKTFELTDKLTGENTKIVVFVAVLPYSQYIYAEGMTSLAEPQWIKVNNHALNYFGGVPAIVVCDNCKQAVIANKDWIDPDLNKDYAEWAEHNHTVILPAKVRKPKYKSSVENAVGILEKGLFHDLEEHRYFSLEQFNRDLLKKVDALNHENFKKKDISRYDLWEEERHELMPLPSEPYQYLERRAAKVSGDFHVRFGNAYYSVDKTYLHKSVMITASADTENLKMMMRGRNCEIHPLHFEQMEGVNTVLPFGVNRLSCFRTMTSESLAAFMPFHVQEVRHKGGCYYGQNAISRNLILADRKQLLNGNSFILGVSGAGKSFAAKAEIVNEVLSSEADILIIDPEREYSSLVKALGGEVIHISASSGNHINAMEINRDYGEEANPVILKSEFILSLCELLKGHLGAKERSILDRCTTAVYRDYVAGGYEGRMPTLKDLYRELLMQEEPEAKSLALEIELYAEGNLNTFAKETNVDTENRILCYDIADLGEQLMSIGMLVVLDSILNRITRNQKEGKNTYVFIDEIYLLFLNEYSANFLFKLWKRVRKKGGFCTGITQDVEDLLRGPTARTMLANSEFILMLNQSPENRSELARLLHISEPQLKHVTDVGAGEGLMKIGKELIPFENHFPKNELYRLMTTKPGEGG